MARATEESFAGAALKPGEMHHQLITSLGDYRTTVRDRDYCIYWVLYRHQLGGKRIVV